MVEVRIADVRRSPAGDDGPRRYVVLLEEAGGTRPHPRRLPIWIGEPQGEALALALEGAAPPRPLTYAFMAATLAAAGGRLRDVRVTRLAEDVFYATATIEGPDGAGTEVDARPSDAFNLALAASGAPILVAADVLDAGAQGAPQAQATFSMPDESWEGAAQIATALRVTTAAGLLSIKEEP